MYYFVIELLNHFDFIVKIGHLVQIVDLSDSVEPRFALST